MEEENNNKNANNFNASSSKKSIFISKKLKINFLFYSYLIAVKNNGHTKGQRRYSMNKCYNNFCRND